MEYRTVEGLKFGSVLVRICVFNPLPLADFTDLTDLKGLVEVVDIALGLATIK